ncbi:MAG: S-layer homology domain-containing protein [Ruminococcus sp.]|nr:S-layer homology domain-containing protein [Ruminococcus sp.]
MRNFKKFLTLVLAVMMVVSAMSFTTTAATNFEDVDAENETLVNAVNLLEYMGITKGVSETEFGAEQAVTREQFALFMYRLMKGGKNAPSNASNTTKFVDLEDPTYFYAISWANAQGIINGTSDTTFHPKNGITLQDAYTMIVRALDYEEEEDLIYPHGYIDVAEQEGVELDAGLPSELGYEDALTRGDMAVLLYNAFFAETAIPTVDERIVSDGDDGWYVKEITTYDRLCEKHFGVKEVKYQAVATPHYAVGDEEATYDLGYDAIFFALVANDDETEVDLVPDYCYLEPADIGLEADELDNYFLGEFTMFITTDEDGEEIEKVLYADCNMVKKTVSDLKLGTVSSNKAESYYEGTDAKLLSGKITSGTEVIYAFNAPYTYIKPNYATDADDELKYLQRNENNIAEIDFDLENDDDVDFYVATLGVDEYGFSNIVTWPDLTDDYFTAQATELLEKFTQVYYDGLYEADLYDVDGDGVYDYIDYKPYSLFQVDSDEDYDFADSTLDEAIPYVYTNEATVVGAEFVDEDYVIGYVDEATQTVKIAEVIKPTVSSISKIKSNTGSVVLSDGTPVNVGSAWKLLANFVPSDENGDAVEGVVTEDSFKDYVLYTANNSGLLKADRLDEEEIELYIYNDVVLLYDGVDNNLKFTENLIIPLQVGENLPEKQFNAETGARVWYIYAWVDGVCKYVPVATEDVLPELIDVDARELTDEYNMQLCTYTIDADGVYTIKSLGFDTDDEDDTDYKGIEKEDVEVLDTDEEDAQFIVVGDTGVTMTKKAGTRFALDGGSLDRDVVLKSYTKILILVHDTEEDEYEMVEYDATSFKASAETAFETVTYLVGNNVDSKSKEDLVLLFATVEDGFDLETKKDKNGQRIVAFSTPGVDENGYYRNYYELLNPFTGTRELDIAGNAYQRTSAGLSEVVLESGTVVELKGGMVDEKDYVAEGEDDYLGLIRTSNEDGLVWITEYDEADDFIAVVPVSATAEACCKEGFEEAIEGFEYAGGEVNFDGSEYITVGDNTTIFYEVNKNTAISVLTYHSEPGIGATQWGTITLGDLSTIADAKKEYKCYSDKVPDAKGNLTTKYAPYLKAYVSATEADDEDDLPVADYIIVVVDKLSSYDMLLTAKDAECAHNA